MKKLMILGGSRYIVPVIEIAHRLGCYVITCDYLPHNIAHKYSDIYCNISIINKDEVLMAAQKFNIDGIISFACDPGVATAAYVAEKMELPFQGPYESVRILQDKGMFREFLINNGFNCPKSKRYTDKNEPYKDIEYFNWPVMVKPVDSAGSKNVTKVDNVNELDKAIDIAIEGSHCGAYIIEDYLTFSGYHSDADIFTIDGKLKFVSYSDQLFDYKAPNPYAPVYIIWPSTMNQIHQDYLTKEIQRLMDLLHMKTGIYNVETCVGIDGRPYIMEVSPRGGGCKIAELQDMAYKTNLIENEIRKAIGLTLVDIEDSICDGYWCEMVIHAGKDQCGILKNIIIKEEIRNQYLKVADIYAKAGDKIEPFMGANKALGDLFLEFNSREELNDVMSKVDKWLTIDVSN